MTTKVPAPLILAPIETVQINTFIGNLTDGFIPHTFLTVTDVNGNQKN